MPISLGDILHFSSYVFNDTREERRHYAVALLDEAETGWSNQVFCAVVTSNGPRKWQVLLKAANHSCFASDSYACVDRQDLESISDLSGKSQPVGLMSADEKKEFADLLFAWVSYKGAGQDFMMPALMKAWYVFR